MGHTDVQHGGTGQKDKKETRKKDSAKALKPKQEGERRSSRLIEPAQAAIEQPQLAVGGGVMAAEKVERGAQGGRADAGNGSSGNGKEDAGAANGKRKAEEEAAAHLVHNTVDTSLCSVCQEQKTVRESAKKRSRGKSGTLKDFWCRDCLKSHRAEERASRPRYTPRVAIATREMVPEHLVGKMVVIGGRVVNASRFC